MELLGEGWANQILQRGRRHKQSFYRQPLSLENEIDSYLSDTATGTEILLFWQVSISFPSPISLGFTVYIKENQLRYPTLFQLAMDILPIQASAVPCERVFSSGKETMTARRNRISSMLMEALQILKFAIIHGHNLNFTTGLGLKDEIEWLSTLETQRSGIPEDLPSFLKSLTLDV